MYSKKSLISNTIIEVVRLEDLKIRCTGTILFARRDSRDYLAIFVKMADSASGGRLLLPAALNFKQKSGN